LAFLDLHWLDRDWRDRIWLRADDGERHVCPRCEFRIALLLVIAMGLARRRPDRSVAGIALSLAYALIHMFQLDQE
jgi:hypothetical protein